MKNKSVEYKFNFAKDSNKNRKKPRSAFTDNKSTSTYEPNVFSEPKKNFMISRLLKKSDKYSEYDCNPYLKKNYIYDDNLKNYPLTGKYLEMKNEKPYNIIVLSEILNKKVTNKINPIKDEIYNVQMIIDNNYKHTTPVKINTKFLKPYSARISKKDVNILENCSGKKDLDMKTNQIPQEFNKGLSIFNKNSLFYESEKFKELKLKNKNVKLCKDKESNINRLNDIFYRFSSAEKKFMKNKLKEKGFFVTNENKIIRQNKSDNYFSKDIIDYYEEDSIKEKIPHTTKVERKHFCFKNNN